MIKEITMYTVICDNCGADHNGESEIAAWNDKEVVVELAEESNWLTVGKKHYCPECYEYDDNEKLVLDESRKKHL